MTTGKLTGGIIEFAGSNSPGWVSNLGFTYTSSTLTITDAGGAALTATNPAWITIPHSTAGQMVSLKAVAATHLFIDDGGASDIIGEQFGVTTGVAWGEDRPFYLYAVNGDNTDSGLAFGISPNPCLVHSPATANIGYHANPMATPSDSGMFMLSASDLTTSHDAVPCVRVGGIRMKMSASDDWTIQALDESKGDGIRHNPFVGHEFTMADQQMGAAAVTDNYLIGTTYPVWATPANTTYYYSLTLEGICRVAYATSSSGNATAGGGADDVSLSLPYTSKGSQTIGRYNAIGYYDCTGAPVGDGDGLAMGQLNNNTSAVLIKDYGNGTLQGNDFSNTGDDLILDFFYRAFIN